MARNFLDLPFQPYNGIYGTKPFNTGLGQKKGAMVAVDLLWRLYRSNGIALGAAVPNFAVSVNLNTAGPQVASNNWTIQSCYIDNEGVDFPVYIYFQDTFFTISCPANSAGWYQVFTNQRQCLIAGIGITTNSILTSQRTRVFFTDTPMVPSLDQEQQSALALMLGSPLLQQTNVVQPGIAAPALGDQIANPTINLTVGTGDTPIPQLSGAGFLYITSVQGFTYKVQNDGTNLAADCQIIMGNDIDAFIFPLYMSAVNGVSAFSPTVQVLDVHGQFRFPGNRNWFLRNVSSNHIASGFMLVNVVFTINPK